MRSDRGFSHILLILLTLLIAIIGFFIWRQSIIKWQIEDELPTTTNPSTPPITKTPTPITTTAAPTIAPEIKQHELVIQNQYYLTIPPTLLVNQMDNLLELRTSDGFLFTSDIVEGNLEDLTTNYTKQSDPQPQYATDDFVYYETTGGYLLFHIYTPIDGNTWIERSYNTEGDLDTNDLATILDSFTPNANTTSWRKYIDDNYKLTLKYPDSWKLTKGTEHKPDAIVLTTESEKPTERSRNVELIIGDYEVYSTSGAACANRSCTDALPSYFLIEKSPHFSQVIKSAWPTKSDFEHFTGSVQSDESELPPIYYSAHNLKQLREIRQIVNTIKLQ